MDVAPNLPEVSSNGIDAVSVPVRPPVQTGYIYRRYMYRAYPTSDGGIRLQSNHFCLLTRTKTIKSKDVSVRHRWFFVHVYAVEQVPFGLSPEKNVLNKNEGSSLMAPNSLEAAHECSVPSVPSFATVSDRGVCVFACQDVRNESSR